MEEQFVPYDLALRLKELGFDGKCFAYYVPEISNNICYYEYIGEMINMNEVKTSKGYICISAPLWQQAFDWFREKYKLDFEIYMNHDINKNRVYSYLILKLEGNVVSHINGSKNFDSYETTREKGLEKLIEICQEQKEDLEQKV